jgi:hypothetical protein
MSAAQSYENHTHHPKATYIAIVFMLAALACIVAGWMGRDTTHLGLLFLFGAVFITVRNGRAYTTALQDRIIRLEMRVRSQKLLSPEQFVTFDRLKKGQIAALRFASDEELPELMRRAVEESLGRKDIKKAVKTWTSDHYRT